VKSISDPSSGAVRRKAADVLGVLMKNQPRVDPVVAELITGARGSDDTISTIYIHALANVVRNASHNVGEKAWESCIEIVAEAFRDAPSGMVTIICAFDFFLSPSSQRIIRKQLGSWSNLCLKSMSC
jgi:hypothetical protein